MLQVIWQMRKRLLPAYKTPKSVGKARHQPSFSTYFKVFYTSMVNSFWVYFYFSNGLVFKDKFKAKVELGNVRAKAQEAFSQIQREGFFLTVLSSHFSGTEWLSHVHIYWLHLTGLSYGWCLFPDWRHAALFHVCTQVAKEMCSL